MIKRNGIGAYVVQLDKFILHVVVGATVRRMIHDLADHDWADHRISVYRTRAAAKLLKRIGSIDAKSASAEADELGALAALIKADGNTQFGGAQVGDRTETGQLAGWSGALTGNSRH